MCRAKNTLLGARCALAGQSPRLVPWLYTAICGTLFAAVTTPGPVAHTLVVGRGPWVAGQVPRLVGNPHAPLAPARHYPVLAELTQLFGAGVPVYVILTGVSV